MILKFPASKFDLLKKQNFLDKLGYDEISGHIPPIEIYHDAGFSVVSKESELKNGVSTGRI